LANDDYKSQGSNEQLQNQELKVEDDDDDDNRGPPVNVEYTDEDLAGNQMLDQEQELAQSASTTDMST